MFLCTVGLGERVEGDYYVNRIRYRLINQYEKPTAVIQALMNYVNENIFCVRQESQILCTLSVPPLVPVCPEEGSTAVMFGRYVR